MSKNLSEQFLSIDLGSWIRIFVIILIIVGAYSWGVIEGSHFSPKYGGYEKASYPRSLSYEMMQKKEVPYMDHDMNMQDPMNMSMRDMGIMLEGKSGDDLNRAFLEGMIPHHQAAVDMAKYLATSNKPELIKLGGDIIVAQTKEIEQMKQWMDEWGYANNGTTLTTGSGNTGTVSTGSMMMDHSMMNH